ncbi:MAG: alpha-E domain-containing protein [Caulobacterales bacterium]|nr:alpha-E domain-containing protein [Caulobacterales bacterium]
MLSRNADHLFWIARYVERAENVARLVDMGYRMAVLPRCDAERASEWASVVISAGCGAGFPHPIGEADQARVAEYLLLDPDNPSSVYACLAQARRNARAVRIALTSQVWEAINDAWIELCDVTPRRIAGGALPSFLDWVKQRGALIRGSIESSFLRSDGYDFLHIGSAIERGDNTARLMDVKYHVLLPQESGTGGVGGVVDHYQWISILEAANSLRSYYWVYGDDIKPWNVADFLILNPLCPRSLVWCTDQLTTHLDRLALAYGARHACHDMLERNAELLRRHDIDTLFQSGLHEFLGGFITRNNKLAGVIGEAYGFVAPPSAPGETAGTAAQSQSGEAGTQSQSMGE